MKHCFAVLAVIATLALGLFGGHMVTSGATFATAPAHPQERACGGVIMPPCGSIVQRH